jgi:hypothetical protein
MSSDGLKLHFATAVWGEAFVDLFCETALPSQLSDGNLGALEARDLGLYVLYTREIDLPRLEASLAFRSLRALMPVEVRLIAEADGAPLNALPADPYHLMSLCHEDALEKASAEGAGCVLLVADAVLGEGSIRSIQEKAKDGAGLVLVAGLRSVKEDFRNWLAGLPRSGEGALALDPRQATAALRRTSESQLRTLFIDSPDFAHGWPSALALPAGDDSLALSLLHPHPIYVGPLGRLDVAVTIDHGSFVDACLARVARVETFASSDDFLLIEMTARDKLEALAQDRRPFDRAAVAAFARTHVQPSGRRFAKRPFLFRGTSEDEAALTAAAARLSREVASLFEDPGAPFQLEPLTSVDQLDAGRRAFFYGAGDLGRDLARAMDARLGGDQGAWRFGGFVDTFRRGEHDGRPVMTLEDLASVLEPQDQVVVTSSRVADISRLLQGIGLGFALDANPWRQARARAGATFSFYSPRTKAV